MQPISRYDIGARLVRLYARPIAKLVDENPNDIREHVRHQPTTAFAVGRNAGLRAGGWLGAMLTVFVLNILVITFERFVLGTPEGQSVTKPFGALIMVMCGLTGFLHAARFVIAWYLTEEKWATASRLRRALVIPGNIDLAIAIFLIACGWALVAAAPPA